jgi:flavin-dependent dehydrogenase
MAKFNSKHADPVDVLILGDHPCAYLAAALVRQKTKLRVVQAALPNREPDDRLVTINPALFDLHPLLEPLKKSLPNTPLHGLKFLSDNPDTSSEHRTKSAVVLVARYTDVRDSMARATEHEGAEFIANQPVKILQVDERGVEVAIGKHRIYPKAVMLAGDLHREQKSQLGIPDSWGPDVVHRFTFARCKAGRHFIANGKMLMPMSLDLCGKLCWGWVLPGEGEFQVMVEQPMEKATASSGRKLLEHWIEVLQKHQVLGPKFDLPESAIRTMDRPLAGALAQEGVANRTLLIGPAGGFYSACGEDIYPACWSALFAADVMKKALKETHLQDALNPFRQKWRTTLGDYLRGPHQNLRFLLPLVYRNPAMTERLTEAILLSKSVVR